MAHPLVPISGPDWFRQLAEAFTRTLQRRNRSLNTIRAYRTTFRRFGAHLEFCRVAEPQHLIPVVLHAWQDQLGEGKPATRAQAASAMRSLLRWAAREESGVPPGLWEHIDPVTIPEQLPRPLWAADVNRILEHYTQACSAPGDDEVRYLELRRDRALFLFLLTASCRISEALSLRRDQIELGGDRLVVRQKGGREHVLVPSAAARAWLQDYMFARGHDDQEPALWVWIGPRGLHRMDLRRANRIWAELCERLRLPRFTSHVLRHTGATLMAADGATDTQVARQLGHRTNQLVHRYRLVDEAQRQAMADGLDRLMPASALSELATPGAPARRSRRRSRAEIMGGRQKR